MKRVVSWVLAGEHGEVGRGQQGAAVGGGGVVGQSVVALALIGRGDPQRRDRRPAEDGGCVHRLGGLHPGEAPAGAGAEVARSLDHDRDVGAHHVPGAQQGGVHRDGLVVAAEGLPGADHRGEQIGLAQAGDAARVRDRQGGRVGVDVGDAGGAAPGADPGDHGGQRGVQIGDHHRHALEAPRGADGLVVLGGRVVQGVHQGLHRRVAGLDHVPGRLLGLGQHLRSGDDQRVPAGAQLAAQRIGVQQHRLAGAGRPGQLPVGQRRHLPGAVLELDLEPVHPGPGAQRALHCPAFPSQHEHQPRARGAQPRSRGRCGR